MNSKRKMIGVLILSGAIVLWVGARLPAERRSEASGRKAYRVTYCDVVVAAGASSLRLHFGDYNLGANSFIRITSLKDGAQQHLDAKSMANYRGSNSLR